MAIDENILSNIPFQAFSKPHQELIEDKTRSFELFAEISKIHKGFNPNSDHYKFLTQHLPAAFFAEDYWRKHYDSFSPEEKSLLDYIRSIKPRFSKP